MYPNYVRVGSQVKLYHSRVGRKIQLHVKAHVVSHVT